MSRTAADNAKLPFGQYKHLVLVTPENVLRCQRCGAQEALPERGKQSGSAFACAVGDGMQEFEARHGGCGREKQGKKKGEGVKA